MNLKKIIDLSHEKLAEASRQARSRGKFSQSNNLANGAGEALKRELHDWQPEPEPVKEEVETADVSTVSTTSSVSSSVHDYHEDGDESENEGKSKWEVDYYTEDGDLTHVWVWAYDTEDAEDEVRHEYWDVYYISDIFCEGQPHTFKPGPMPSFKEVESTVSKGSSEVSASSVSTPVEVTKPEVSKSVKSTPSKSTFGSVTITNRPLKKLIKKFVSGVESLGSNVTVANTDTYYDENEDLISIYEIDNCILTTLEFELSDNTVFVSLYEDYEGVDIKFDLRNTDVINSIEWRVKNSDIANTIVSLLANIGYGQVMSPVEDYPDLGGVSMADCFEVIAFSSKYKKEFRATVKGLIAVSTLNSMPEDDAQNLVEVYPSNLKLVFEILGKALANGTVDSAGLTYPDSDVVLDLHGCYFINPDPRYSLPINGQVVQDVDEFNRLLAL